MFWEVRRKDFLEMFAHHIVTLALITYSYSLKCASYAEHVPPGFPLCDSIFCWCPCPCSVQAVLP